MWTSIYIANDEGEAMRLKEKLEEEGILAHLNPIKTKAKAKACQYEVQVPETEVLDAQTVICDK